MTRTLMPTGGRLRLNPEVLVAVEVEVVRTFRSPHVTLAIADIEAGLGALETVEHEIRPNPHHEG